jgi:hypothetical protein
MFSLLGFAVGLESDFLKADRRIHRQGFVRGQHPQIHRLVDRITKLATREFDGAVNVSKSQAPAVEMATDLNGAV